MTNNDILRRLRYALNISDATLEQIFNLAEIEIEAEKIANFMRRDDEEGFQTCNDKTMQQFLDGLIIYKRGQKGGAKPAASRFSNNAILKKLRIALELQEDDMLGILKLAEIDISKSELSALFRKEGHKHYKNCGDQILRNFLKGLTIRYRGKS